jgi:hypothetical protein
MSMDHKAYPLDYEAFERELAPLLSSAVQSGDIDELRTFVERNFAALKDPAEGGPLGPDWLTLVEPPLPNRPDLAVQLWGDLALTKFYDPAKESGLSTDWQDAEERLKAVGLEPAPIVLGHPLGGPEHYFDPGLQGAYFQSPDEVRRGLQALDDHAVDHSEPLRTWRDLLNRTADQGQGLYVTF